MGKARDAAGLARAVFRLVVARTRMEQKANRADVEWYRSRLTGRPQRWTG